jgi:hypothetical protein
MCKGKVDGKLVEPNSLLWHPVHFVINQWSLLTKFYEVPGIPLDSNIIEQTLIIPVRYLAGSFTYQTQTGAEVGDRHMSLIATANANGVEPVAYLTECLRNHEDLAKRPEYYLPWVYRDRLEKEASVLQASDPSAEQEAEQEPGLPSSSPDPPAEQKGDGFPPDPAPSMPNSPAVPEVEEGDNVPQERGLPSSRPGPPAEQKVEKGEGVPRDPVPKPSRTGPPADQKVEKVEKGDGIPQEPGLSSSRSGPPAEQKVEEGDGVPRDPVPKPSRPGPPAAREVRHPLRPGTHRARAQPP